MCSINGSLSRSCSLSCGVPQGKILGPCTAISVVHQRSVSNWTLMTPTGKNTDLENVHNWLKVNKLSLNMTETEFMLIGSRQRLSTLTESLTFAIYDFQVIQVTTVKSLGVAMIGVATSRK